MGCPKKDQLFRSCSSCTENFPEITWVSARIEGTRLILNIQEGIIPQKPTVIPHPVICSQTRTE